MKINKKSNRWRLPARAMQLILAVVLLEAVLGGCDLLFPPEYVLSFDANGGAGTMDAVGLETNEQTTLPANEFTRDGYTFTGWATTAEGTVEYGDEASYTMGTGDATLYAVWSANTDTAYTVEHYQQDTSGSGYTIVTADTESLSGTTGATATATAKTYTGFSENTSYTDRVASGTIAGNGSLVLKLYYDRDTFTVSYEENGGSSVSDTTDVRYGAMISAPTDPTKAGYSFEGWYTDVELTDAWDFTADTVTEDATLYAAWESVDPTVGDLGPAGGYIFYDDTVGYDFDGNSTIESTEKDLLDGTNDGTVSGDRYLEAAPYGWYNNGDDPLLAWGGANVYMGGLSDEVGRGQANTDKIVAALTVNSRIITPPPAPDPKAAPACDDYSVTVDGTTYDDWFLPSKNEMLLIYKNLNIPRLGGFLQSTTAGSAKYWTSYDTGRNDLAYALIFDTHYNGSGTGYGRDNLNYVRPVRAY